MSEVVKQPFCQSTHHFTNNHASRLLACGQSITQWPVNDEFNSNERRIQRYDTYGVTWRKEEEEDDITRRGGNYEMDRATSRGERRRGARAGY